MINNIKISKFVVFKEITFNFSPGVNVIIGENGTGKTLLLKAIYANEDARKKCSEGKCVEGLESFFYNENLVATLGIEGEYADSFLSNVDFTINGDSTPDPVFIPAKEMLTHARGLLVMKEKYGKNMPFDITLLDIIKKAQIWKLEKAPPVAYKIAPLLKNAIDGTVDAKDDGSFWMKKSNGTSIPFSMEAEGLRHLGLIWQLLMNGSIKEDSTILWDEPESNLNPNHLPLVADIILELQRNGVQLIITTHEYNLARYIDIKKQNDDKVKFISLYKEKDTALYSAADSFLTLKPNSIDDAGEQLYKDVIQKSMDDLHGE
ncbi:MAG: AAA family ATPase [Chitinispirillales bacterium]|jgi:predicted ATPase|nr:AAA family ATPase [Chitinispirillales bacterium]